MGFTLSVDGHVELALMDERHAEQLFALTDSSRAYLREWLPWLDGVTSPADSRGFIAGALQQFAEGNGFQAGIWYRGELAGVIGYHYVNRANRATSIGYWLGATFQGKGIMTRACRALVEYAFGELALNRIEVHCATGNTRSRAIPERLGFTVEGTLRQAEWLYDRYVDHVVYAMLAEDWKPARDTPV